MIKSVSSAVGALDKMLKFYDDTKFFDRPRTLVEAEDYMAASIAHGLAENGGTKLISGGVGKIDCAAVYYLHESVEHVVKFLDACIELGESIKGMAESFDELVTSKGSDAFRASIMDADGLDLSLDMLRRHPEIVQKHPVSSAYKLLPYVLCAASSYPSLDSLKHLDEIVNEFKEACGRCASTNESVLKELATNTKGDDFEVLVDEIHAAEAPDEKPVEDEPTDKVDMLAALNIVRPKFGKS